MDNARIWKRERGGGGDEKERRRGLQAKREKVVREGDEGEEGESAKVKVKVTDGCGKTEGGYVEAGEGVEGDEQWRRGS